MEVEEKMPKLYRHHIGVYMSESEYLLWPYGQCEKLMKFPPDPLTKMTGAN